AARTRHARVVGDVRRSPHVDKALDVCDEPDSRRIAADFRVRLPRRELRAAECVVGGACRRSGCEEVIHNAKCKMQNAKRVCNATSDARLRRIQIVVATRAVFAFCILNVALHRRRRMTRALAVAVVVVFGAITLSAQKPAGYKAPKTPW